MRPKQWIKNGLIFAALVFDRKLLHVVLTRAIEQLWVPSRPTSVTLPHARSPQVRCQSGLPGLVQ